MTNVQYTESTIIQTLDTNIKWLPKEGGTTARGKISHSFKRYVGLPREPAAPGSACQTGPNGKRGHSGSEECSPTNNAPKASEKGKQRITKRKTSSNKAPQRQTWFDSIRTKRSSTSWPQSTTGKPIWPGAVRPNMAPMEEEIHQVIRQMEIDHARYISEEDIEEMIRQMDIKHAEYMTRHTSTENTTSHRQGPSGLPMIQGPPTEQDTEHNQCNPKGEQTQPEKNQAKYTKAAWTITIIIMAAITLCITAGVIVKTCTKCREPEHNTRDHNLIISNPRIDSDENSDEHIYDTLDFTSHSGYTHSGYTHDKYMPLSLYTHYRSPRHIMATNTLTHIDPSMDQYSITTRSNMSGSLSGNWPEKRESFIIRGSPINWQENKTNYPKRGGSNNDIYVSMDRTHETIRKSQSADTSIRVPRAAVLLTLIMLTSTLGETQAQAYPKHLNNIDGKPHSQEKIITKIAGDLLLFENFPTAKQPGLIYEKIDLSILDKLESDIDELTEYADYLHTQVQTTLLTAEFHCPKGPSMLTETITKPLKVPYYIDAYEIPRSPAKKYTILLTESTATVKRCTYYLSYSLIHKLMAKHEHSTSAYYYNRLEKYQNFKSWLFHSTSRTTPCQEGVDVARGEITSKDTALSTKIETHEGALYACTELCQNMAQTFAAQTKITTQCLAGKCNKTDTPNCQKWSYNWSSNWCRISSKANPRIETSYYRGNNALTASPECASMDQHSKVNILVNSTTREARQICKFSERLPLGTMAIYKSCPGQSVQLQTAIIPLKTLLTTYRLQLQSKSDRETEMHDHDTAIKLNSVNQHRLTQQESHNRGNKRLENMPNTWKESNNAGTRRNNRNKRNTENLDTQIINSLKPKLESFIKQGCQH